MNVNTIGQNQMDALNSGTKLSTAKTDLQKTSLTMSKESSSKTLIKNDRDVFIRTSSKSSYYNNYDESDLNYSYRKLTGEQVFSNYQSNSYRAQYATGSDKYKYQALADSYSKEDDVRNALEYTKDIDAVANGKLKDMQENTDYHYSQFVWGSNTSDNGNSCCAATACATMLGLNNNRTYSLDDFDTNSKGWFNSWPTSTEQHYCGSSDEYMNTIKSELQEGKSCVIHVDPAGSSTTHWLTVVGVKEGIDLEDASFDDLLVVDPGRYAQPSPVTVMSNTYKDYNVNSDYKVVTTK